MDEQQTLDRLTYNLEDIDTWTLRIIDDHGNTVAIARSILFIQHIALLMSVKYPQHRIEVSYAGLAHCVCKAGVVELDLPSCSRVSNLSEEDYVMNEEIQLEIAKARERIGTICSIAKKRILRTRSLLGIPDDISRVDYLIAKSEENIQIVENTVIEVNRMINAEITAVGVRIVMTDEIQFMVDGVREELAMLINILSKGFPSKTVQNNESNTLSIASPAVIVAGVVTAVIVIILGIIAFDGSK
jgi:hypothetical protein